MKNSEILKVPHFPWFICRINQTIYLLVANIKYLLARKIFKNKSFEWRTIVFSNQFDIFVRVWFLLWENSEWFDYSCVFPFRNSWLFTSRFARTSRTSLRTVTRLLGGGGHRRHRRFARSRRTTIGILLRDRFRWVCTKRWVEVRVL